MTELGVSVCRIEGRRSDSLVLASETLPVFL